MSKIKSLPSILAFKRGLMITDATFENIIGQRTTPVWVVRHGIAGTQNTSKSTDNASLIQITDTAKLDAEATGLRVRFGLGFFDLKDALYSCSAKGKSAKEHEDKLKDVRLFLEALFGFIDRAKGSNALMDIGCRYARNITNGRWLWRNRTLASKVTVSVLVDGDKEILFSDSLSIPLNSFGKYSKQELELGKLIEECLSGQAAHRFDIAADLDFGIRGALEVFPSQNYLESKPRGFARPLYSVRHSQMPKSADSDLISLSTTRVIGQAALRDQKVSNALRTFDTWFADSEEVGPISIEPNGANMQANKFFRDNKNSAFALMKEVAELDPSSDEGLFLIACLLRGALLGEAEKKE